MRGIWIATAALTLSAGAAQAQTKAELRAATATSPGGATEVRLRWPISQGWLPDGGFRLYRTGADGQRRQIFPKTVPAEKLTKFAPKAEALQTLSLKGSNLGATLGRAATRTRSVDDAPLFDPPGTRAPSSAALFGLQAKTVRARSLASPFAALKARSLDSDDDTPPELLAYRKRIEQGALTARSAARAPAPEDSVRESRQDLLLSALTRPQVASELGIAATDTGKPGEAIAYELFAVGADGKEGAALATLKFTVGDNPAPAALQGLQAEQIGEGRVALRWERPSKEEESRLGVVTYKLTRVDARSPAGKPLTDTPFFLGEIAAQGGPLEPIAFFADEEAAVGPTTYRVSALDMFGRESPVAEKSLTVEDMRPATPAKLAQAALQRGLAQVVWQKSATPGARYRVWRRDAEIEGSSFAPLTPAPIDGAPLGQEQLPSYEDRTAQPDHRYVYAVTAQLPGSRAESAASETRVVAFPAPAPGAPTLAAPVFKQGQALLAPLRTFPLVTADAPRASAKRAVTLADRAELAWSAPAGQKNLRYRVYRGVGASVGADDWELCDETTETRFADPLPAARALSYSYKVVAVNRWDAVSAPATARLDAPATLPPSQPAILNVVSEPRGGLLVKVQDAPSDEGVARYRVERKEIRPLVLQLTQPVFMKALRGAQAGLTARGEGAVDGQGEPLSVPLRDGALVARAGEQALRLEELPESSKGYAVVSLAASAPDANGVVTLADPSATSGRTYYYRVAAETGTGLRSEISEPRGARALPPKSLPAPTGLTASANPGGGALVRWSPVPGATRYLVVRTGGAAPKLLRPAAGQTNVADVGARPGVAYRYAVRALGASGTPSPPAETAFTVAR